jgi:hypothetical protein
MMCILIMRLQVHNRSGCPIRSRRCIHVSDRDIAGSSIPHAEVAGASLGVDFPDSGRILVVRRAAVVVTGLYNIE